MKIVSQIKEKESRSKQVTKLYLNFLDSHIDDVVKGVEELFDINRIAREIAVSHPYLIELINKEKGRQPCYFYNKKIIDSVKYLLKETDLSVFSIAVIFSYDPSNFSKFFKRWTGQTPGGFREGLQP